MKCLIVLSALFALLLPSLVMAADLETTVLVYKGKHQMVGHEFVQGENEGTAFKGQDEIWLAIELDVNNWDILDAREISCRKTETGYQGVVTALYNLDLVVDEYSAKQVATLYSMDLNNDSDIPSAVPSDRDALVMQGPMAVTFTGINSYLVPKSLKGYGMGLWDWTDSVTTYNDIGAGQLLLKLDKKYTQAANGDALGLAGVVEAIATNLAAGKGVDFGSQQPPGQL
jgi:hypothetical protein